MDILARFTNKVALITGGASGIGLASAVRMAAEGASVGIADIKLGLAQNAVKAVQAVGGKAIAIQCDVTKAADNERMVAETVKAFGRLDILVTSAGIHGGFRTVVDTPLELWHKVLDIDLTGAYLASKFAVPHMQKAGGGSIIHISSISGLRGSDHGTAFHSAKGGLVNLTRHMAVAHARENIRVNCICPGVIGTPLTEQWLSDPETYKSVCAAHPLNRIGRPEEVAAVTAFLASNEASFVTGIIMPVDGGYIAWSHF
jgi:NAD(P)-dependent dehydrogenase (short-subunit alcohol dehydrogenase family)